MATEKFMSKCRASCGWHGDLDTAPIDKNRWHRCPECGSHVVPADQAKHVPIVFGSKDAQLLVSKMRELEFMHTPIGFARAMSKLDEGDLDSMDDIAENIANEIGQAAFERDYLGHDIELYPRKALLDAGQIKLTFK